MRNLVLLYENPVYGKRPKKEDIPKRLQTFQSVQKKDLVAQKAGFLRAQEWAAES